MASCVSGGQSPCSPARYDNVFLTCKTWSKSYSCRRIRYNPHAPGTTRRSASSRDTAFPAKAFRCVARKPPLNRNFLSLQRLGNPKRPPSGNRHVKDAFHYGRGFLVDNPAVFVLRVKTVAVGRYAQMFAAVAFCLYDGANFLAGIAAVKFLGRGAEANPALLESVDVMLELSADAPSSYRTGTPPAPLRFSVPDSNSPGAFLVTRYGDDAARMEPVAEERIILLFDGRGQADPLPVLSRRQAGKRKTPLFRPGRPIGEYLQCPLTIC